MFEISLGPLLATIGLIVVGIVIWRSRKPKP
jgi:hypothetical protein